MSGGSQQLQPQHQQTDLGLGKVTGLKVSGEGASDPEPIDLSALTAEGKRKLHTPIWLLPSGDTTRAPVEITKVSRHGMLCNFAKSYAVPYFALADSNSEPTSTPEEHKSQPEEHKSQLQEE
ncbi:hypothetical protein B484DRAFT_409020 [Ochromonadaceae sp. CCMP2298]|nr:hypothetical protein B484DRAFT_409020 [Ochromonadaceae sp. CCMP2298]